MSKDRRKLLHIHSSVNDKQPTPATLELGELGVNNACGNAFISTKNSSGEVVRFSEDDTIINWMEMKEVIPYDGYVRGSSGQKDYYDPDQHKLVNGMTEQDLLDNRSNIVIKLNQPVSSPMSFECLETDGTQYWERVNGAKDIWGNLVNPTGSTSAAIGIKDGAGFAIDMSRYAMIGANPSFSSVTTTCRATFNGTTEVIGKNDSCGSQFNVNVKDSCYEASDTLNIYGRQHSNFGVSCSNPSVISLDTNLKGEKIFIDSPSGNETIDMHACNHISAKTNNFIVEDCTSGQATIDVNDLCLVGRTRTNLYGDETNVGLDCDNTQIAANTRSFGKGTLITTKETPSAYAAQGSVEIISNIIKENADNDINETAGRSINESAPTLNYSGNTTNISGDSSVNVRANANGGDITVYANDILCESGKTVTIFAGEGGKLTIGGNSCDGNTNGTYPITYVRRGSGCVTANTVDGALQEVLERDRVNISSATSTSHIDDVVPSSGTSVVRSGSTTYTVSQDSGSCKNEISFTVNDTVVSMSAHSHSSAEELAKTYTLWQYIGGKRVEIGSIDIPKDHWLKDAEVVNGHYNETTKVFTPCVSGDGTCHWYIKLTMNVFDPETGHPDDKIIYVPADALVKDYEFHNSPAINFYQWYDGQKNHVSADTTLNFTTPNDTNAFTYAKHDGAHWESGTTLVFNGGSFSQNKYKPWSASTSVNIPTDAQHINRNTLNIVYGDVCGGQSQSYDPANGTVNTTRSSNITIPRNVSNLSHTKMTIKYGATSGETAQGYDPGSTVNNCTVGNTDITIPSNVSHLKRGTLKFTHCNQTVEFDPASNSLNNALTHGKLTINRNNTKIGEYNACSDSTINIDVPSVEIPTCVSSFGRSTLAYQYGATSAKTSSDNGTYDPGERCDNQASDTIVIPTSVCHLTRGILTINRNGVKVDDFDPCSNKTINIDVPTYECNLNVDFKYGNPCTNSATSGNVTCATTGKTFWIPKTSSDLVHKKFKFKFNKCDGTSTYSNEYDITSTGCNDTNTVEIPLDLGNCGGGGGGIDCAQLGKLTVNYGGSVCNASTVEYHPCTANTITIPKYIQDISGGKVHFSDNACSGECLNIDTNLCVSGTVVANSFFSSSDRRLKDNISDLDKEEISKIDNVKIKSFNFNDDESKRKTYGVIAQEVQEAGFNNIVHTDENGMLSVDYVSLLLLKIANMENTINDLTKRVNILSNRLNLGK